MDTLKPQSLCNTMYFCTITGLCFKHYWMLVQSVTCFCGKEGMVRLSLQHEAKLSSAVSSKNATTLFKPRLCIKQRCFSLVLQTDRSISPSTCKLFKLHVIQCFDDCVIYRTGDDSFDAPTLYTLSDLIQ